MLYAKELQIYTFTELQNKFNFNTQVISELLNRKVLYKDEKNTFVFKFVGILIVDNDVVFCLPKYVSNKDKSIVVKKILSLLKEYSKRERLDADEIETIGNIDSIFSYNLLSTIIFLLSDYFENGLYSNEKNIFVLNGEDEVNWIKTMNEVGPIINDGEPIYLEYFSNAIQNDEENYFRHLHMYILNLCSEKLLKLGLSEYLGLNLVFFDENDDKLGNLQTMITKINNELSTQFISRKQMVLKVMNAFLLNQKMDRDGATISFYGTRSFYNVWEKTCGYVLNNKYDEVKKYIARPEWKTMSGKIFKVDTLIPDIVSIKDNLFVICDAKYYNIVLDDKRNLKDYPGVEDITKQYLYQLAFEQYNKEKKFSLIKNILLFPTEESVMHKIGSVSIEFLKFLKLEDIELYKLPAEKIFDYYIKGKKIDLYEFIKCNI